MSVEPTLGEVMSEVFVSEVNAVTGEEIVRPATAEELAQMEIDRQDFERVMAARRAAKDKLAALGLTVDDLKAIMS